MFIFKCRIIIMALMSTVTLASAAIAQTDVKCDEAEKDCPKAEARSDKSTNDQVSLVAADSKTKFEPAKFKLEFDRSSLTKPKAGSDAAPAATQQQAQADDSQALAKQLANPVASLISVPFQSNFDFGMGEDEKGFRYTLNFQPVIPIKINKDWNLISRTILPIIGQSDVVGTSSQFGLGDVVQSFFFSPNKAEPFVWGAGPVVLIPTGTNQYLGSQKFGLGFTGLILKQTGQWTVGSLMNHIWSVAGKESRADVSLTYFQPFLSYTTKTAWTVNLNTEMTYDWNAKTSNVPIHFTVSKLVRFGKQPVSIGGALRCWAHSAPGGPQWCGFRLIFTPLFPKK